MHVIYVVSQDTFGDYVLRDCRSHNHSSSKEVLVMVRTAGSKAKVADVTVSLFNTVSGNRE